MKYLSKYSNGKMVSPAQYITEIICEHLAIRNKKDLHYRFWLSKEWQNFYKSQIFTAYKLLKKYSDKAIIKALQSDDGKKIFSLRAPHLLGIIEHHEILVSQQNTEQKTEIIRTMDSQGKIKSSKKSILDKIKDIDNGN